MECQIEFKFPVKSPFLMTVTVWRQESALRNSPLQGTGSKLFILFNEIWVNSGIYYSCKSGKIFYGQYVEWRNISETPQFLITSKAKLKRDAVGLFSKLRNNHRTVLPIIVSRKASHCFIMFSVFPNSDVFPFKIVYHSCVGGEHCQLKLLNADYCCIVR